MDAWMAFRMKAVEERRTSSVDIMILVPIVVRGKEYTDGVDTTLDVREGGKETCTILRTESPSCRAHYDAVGQNPLGDDPLLSPASEETPT